MNGPQSHAWHGVGLHPCEARAMSFELDANLRKKIEKRRRQERDARIWRRLTAILWLAEGATGEEVAARLGVSARQVRKWLKAFRTHGLDALCELRYQGRVPRLNDAQLDELAFRRFFAGQAARFAQFFRVRTISPNWA